MPKTVTIIKVFVASPGDVQEERDALQAIVDEVNHNLGSAIGIRLELVKWETDVTPAFGKDPQDIINNQIGDDYDIFIGLLWTRAGTPTPRAESGTLEEFERAYERHKQNPDAVDLLVYFKDSPISPSKMDTNQMQKIQTFKRSLGEKGGLYWTFDSLQDFETTLRGHLSTLTRSWKAKIETAEHPVSSIQPIDTFKDVKISPTIEEANTAEVEEAISIIENEDDYGFLDYIDIYNSSFLEMSSALDGITKATKNIGSNVAKQTKAINFANQIKDQSKVNIRVRNSLKIISGDLHSFSTSMDNDIQLLTKSRNRGFDALGKSLVVYADSFPDAQEQLQINENQLSELLVSMESPYQSMQEFRDAIDRLPKFTSQFNKARREAKSSLNRLLVELDEIRNTVVNLLDSIKKLKNG